MSTEKSVLDRYLIVTMPNGERYAKKLPVAAQVVDYEDGWVNGEKEIGDLP